MGTASRAEKSVSAGCMIAGLIVVLPSADAVYIKPERIEVTKKEHLRPTSYRGEEVSFQSTMFLK